MRPVVVVISGPVARTTDNPTLSVTPEQQAAGIGRHQSEVMGWALARGADGIRTGLEDNIRAPKTRLADGNAELVRIAVDLCARHEARPASPAEARSRLSAACSGQAWATRPLAPSASSTVPSPSR